MESRTHTCRFCDTPLRYTFVDLGPSPLANSYLKPEQLFQMEPFYPLHVYVCNQCLLVQLPVFETAESIFTEYAYFSSVSESWLRHASDYVQLMTEEFGIDQTKQVIEIASNDGYLLQYFQKKKISVLGIEPAQNVADVAKRSGIPTIVDFFCTTVAEKLTKQNIYADLLIGNNVLAHVPALNDFVTGLRHILKQDGIITLEFPHLLHLIEENQFDTIYHEHFSYFSFTTVNKIFADQGLTIFDVAELPTHGGSLRIYLCHTDNKFRSTHSRVNDLLSREEAAGYKSLATYLSFGEQVKRTKREILNFFIDARTKGKSVAGYGAPAKGNTLLNYCGIRTDFLDYTVDRSVHKQGLFLPGTRLPIHHPDKISETKPDYLVILPWNLRAEIMEQMSHIRRWGGRFVTLIPNVRIF